MLFPVALDGVSTDAQLARPLGDRQAFTAPLNPVRQGAVAILLEGVRPLAIAWRVSLRVIDAVNRVAVRSWSHVGVEVGEVSPAVVHGQSFAAVARKQYGGRIAAALNHARPNAVFAALVEAVLRAGRRHQFAVQAAARLCSGLQMVSSHARVFTALASAQPPLHAMSGVPRGLRHLFYDGQASKDASRQVNDWSAHKRQTITKYDDPGRHCESVPASLPVVHVGHQGY